MLYFRYIVQQQGLEGTWIENRGKVLYLSGGRDDDLLCCQGSLSYLRSAPLAPGRLPSNMLYLTSCSCERHKFPNPRGFLVLHRHGEQEVLVLKNAS